MSFWGRLFGSSKATEEVISAVKSGVDALWYTDEEKAHDKAKSISEARSVLLDWIKHSQGQNLARRLLAITIGFSWIFFKMIGAALAVSAWWLPGRQTELLKSADVMSAFSSDMTPAVMLILGFYFAAPYMGKLAESAITRFGDRNSGRTEGRTS